MGAAGLSWWRGIGWLYLIQAAQLALPLVSVPYLARALQPDAFGRVAAAQGLAMLAGVAVEFGFNLSGVRMVARAREHPAQLRRTVSALLAAQTSLLIVAAAGVWLVRPWISFLADDPALCAGALVWMIPQVISFQWLFQGLEQMPWLAGWILVGRLAGLAGLLAAVDGPADGALSLFVQGGAGIIALGAAVWEPVRRLRPARVSAGEVWAVLREGSGLCVYRAGVALQGAATTFLLALVLGPVAAGAYAGAERLARASLGMLEPLLVTVFPRLAYLHGRGRGEAAAAFDRSSFWLVCGAGLLTAAGLAGGAPWLIDLLLGPGYGEAVTVLRMLALWPLASALCQMRGLNGLVARGRDRQLTRSAVGGGVIQLAGFALLGWCSPGGLLCWVAAWVVTAQFLQWVWLETVAAAPGERVQPIRP